MGFLGQQYRLPQEQYEAPASPQMRGPMNQQQAFQEGLLGLEEDVKGYYKDWGAIQNFAHGMWTNYGIDVTAPDPMNPASVEMYNLYLQGLAQVQERGNRMKNRQELFKAGFEQSLRDPNVRFSQGAKQETFDPTQDIANIGLTDESKSVIGRLGRSVKSKEEFEQLSEYQDQAIRELEERWKEASGDPNLQRQIQSQIDAVKKMSPSYDPTFDKQLAAQMKIAWIRKNEKTDKSYTSARVQEIANVKAGNVDFLRNLTDGKGMKIFKHVRYVPAMGEVILQPFSNEDPVRINLRAKDGGAKDLNNLLNEYRSVEDEEVDWNEVVGWGLKYKDELGDIKLITPNEPYKSHAGIKMTEAALKNPKDADHENVITGLKSAAGRGELVMPPVSGLFGKEVKDVSFDWKLFERGTGFSSKVRIDYVKDYDKNGNPVMDVKVIDPESPQDEEFLNLFLQTNSDVIDFGVVGRSKEIQAAMKVPTPEGMVKMLDREGRVRHVSEADVNEAVQNHGYTILD